MTTEPAAPAIGAVRHPRQFPELLPRDDPNQPLGGQLHPAPLAGDRLAASGASRYPSDGLMTAAIGDAATSLTWTSAGRTGSCGCGTRWATATC